MKYGKRFKLYRIKAGYNQKQAAEIIGINNYQLGNYETDRSEPNIDVLKAMSKAYGVSIDTLVGNKPIKKTAKVVDNSELEQIIKEFVEFYEGRDDK